jgi:hypothetical protein
MTNNTFVEIRASLKAGHAAHRAWLCDSRRAESPRNDTHANSKSRQHVNKGVGAEKIDTTSQ